MKTNSTNWAEIAALATMVISLVYFGVEFGKVIGTSVASTVSQSELRADIRQLEHDLTNCRRERERE